MNSKRASHPRTAGPWTQIEVELLGRMSDSVLARRLGRTIFKEVTAEREARRIGLNRGPRQLPRCGGLSHGVVPTR